MELYKLNALLRRETVIDKFESLIWTERFDSAGDFELVVHSTPATRRLFTVDSKLATNVSHRVMVVETVEDHTDTDGKTILTVKGPSLESITKNRVARSAMTNTTVNPKWTLTGTPGDVIRKIFRDICVTGVLSTADIIPFINEGNVLYPDDTIAEPTATISVDLEIMSVYDALTKLCSLYDLGFRIARNYDNSGLYFDVYSGSDRTTFQSVLPAVVFSKELENLQDTTELTTISSYKNVAYVFSPVGVEVVYPDGVNTSIAGFDRRVLMVRADDITSTVPATASALMIQRGKEELAKNRQLSAFDGELNQNSTYKYGVDYNLGDLVELRNADGVVSNRRVMEQIFSLDNTGERSYPTLSTNFFLSPGTWLAWDYEQVWEDLGLTDYWSTA